MKTLSSDTHPEVEQFHIELIRKAPAFKQLQMVASLVKTTRHLSWLGICERYPKESVGARIKRFVFLLYKDRIIAQRVVALSVGVFH